MSAEGPQTTDPATLKLIHSLYVRSEPTPPKQSSGGVAELGQPYTAVEIYYRNKDTGHQEKETIEMSGTWGGDQDPATDRLGKDFAIHYNPTGYYAYRAVLLSGDNESQTAFTVPLDRESITQLGLRAHERSVARRQRQDEIEAHSFPAKELRKTMRVQLKDGRAITIGRIRIHSFSTDWSVYGTDDDGNEISGVIDSRKPVYVFNHTRAR